MRASVACCHLATDQYQRLQTAQLKSPDGDLGMLSWPWSFSALLYRLTAHAHFHNLLREAATRAGARACSGNQSRKSFASQPAYLTSDSTRHRTLVPFPDRTVAPLVTATAFCARFLLHCADDASTARSLCGAASQAALG